MMMFRRLLIRRRTGPVIEGTSVSLNDVANQRVYQRIGTAKAVPVSGTGNGSAVKVRAINAETSVAVTGWTTIAVSGGAWSGVLSVPQGGWYKIEVADSVNEAVSVVGANNFGVGIVIGLIGQSNMAGFSTAVAQYPLGSKFAVEYAGDGAYKRIGNINDSYPPGTISPNYPSWSTEGARGDGIVLFVNAVAAASGVPVCVINRAVNGSAIASWQAGQSNWNAFVSAVNASGGDMEFCLWHQGESDAATKTGASYKNSLANLHNNARSLVGRTNSNFHFGVSTLGPGSFAGSLEGDFGKIRIAQVEYATSTDGAFYTGATHDGALTDGVHFNASSQMRNGKRWANALGGRLTGVDRSGPKITSGSVSGNIITLNITHAGGALLSDGGGGSGASLSGFVVQDSIGQVSITGTAIANPSIITLTLGSQPVGATTVTYGLSNTPHGSALSTDLATAVYDNQVVEGGRGMPLAPRGALAVQG